MVTDSLDLFGEGAESVGEQPMVRKSRTGKSASAYRTISEAATELELETHVLRFWETKFKQLSPIRRNGGRRFYRPQEIALLRRIKSMLHEEGYTIKGVQTYLKKNRTKDDALKPETVITGRKMVEELREIRNLLTAV